MSKQSRGDVEIEATQGRCVRASQVDYRRLTEGSSGTRAGDIWKKANQDLENSRRFLRNNQSDLLGLLKWSPRTLVYIIPSFSIQN